MVATWRYQPPLDEVLTGLKFRRLDYLGAHLGRAMAGIHRRELADGDVVTAVPLHWRRRLARGYDQAALIARPLARELGIPFARLLRRRRSTPAQSRLDAAARRDNLKDAFTVTSPAACRGRRVIVVDDVLTTGATLGAAAACLVRAGAKVTGVAAARTPRATSDPPARAAPELR